MPTTSAVFILLYLILFDDHPKLPIILTPEVGTSWATNCSASGASVA
jgi:hypothetical protein